MPNKDSHLATAIENRALAIELLDTERSLAWSATICCYSALHLIEAYFAQQGEHCDDHAVRNQRLRSERPLQNLWKHYAPLYNASLRARYLTTDNGSAEDQIRRSVGKAKLREKLIDHHLRQIEKSVGKRLSMAKIFE